MRVSPYHDRFGAVCHVATYVGNPNDSRRTTQVDDCVHGKTIANAWQTA